MPDHELSDLLGPAVSSVLETMFFSEALESCDPEPAASVLEARVAFSGERSGSVSVCISEPAARVLAGSFLGESEDSLQDAQVAQIVCELANMLCGSIVTRIESHGTFDLAAPELLSDPAQSAIAKSDFQQSFSIDRGTLTVSLTSCEPE